MNITTSGQTFCVLTQEQLVRLLAALSTLPPLLENGKQARHQPRRHVAISCGIRGHKLVTIRKARSVDR